MADAIERSASAAKQDSKHAVVEFTSRFAKGDIDGLVGSLGADEDIETGRGRIVAVLSTILGTASDPAGIDIVQDVMAMVAALVNTAASRGERNAARLAVRLETVVRAAGHGLRTGDRRETPVLPSRVSVKPEESAGASA